MNLLFRAHFGVNFLGGHSLAKGGGDAGVRHRLGSLRALLRCARAIGRGEFVFFALLRHDSRALTLVSCTGKMGHSPAAIAV